MNTKVERDIIPAFGGCPPLEALPPAPDIATSTMDDRLRILFIAVNDDQARLALDEEHHAIRDSLAPWRERFVLESALALRIDELGRELRDHSPHVVHFGGHGTQAGELLLKDGARSFAGISTDALQSLLRENARDLKLVVLNACFSREHASAACDIAGIAIGMSRQISDEAAIAFSRTLYETLAGARSVLDAFGKARAEIKRTMAPGDATVPTLHVRADLDASRVYLVGVARRTAPPAHRLGLWSQIRAPIVAILLTLAAVAASLTGAPRCLPSDGGGDLAVKVKLVDDTGQPVKVTGRVRLEIGAYTRTALVDGTDLIEFDLLPHRVDGGDAAFTLESHAFRIASPTRRYRLQANGILYLELLPIVTRVSGTVSFAGARMPVGRISIVGYDCSGEVHDGFFEIPCTDARPPVKVQVREPESYTKRVCVREFVLQQLTNNELVLGACSLPPPPPPPPPPCPRSPEELIQREAELVLRHDLAGVVGLFVPNATFSDAQLGTTQSPLARYRAELAKHRFTAASHAEIRYTGSDGRVWLYTSSSAGRLSDGSRYTNPAESDHWVLEKVAECWRVQSLTINAVGKPFGL